MQERQGQRKRYGTFRNREQIRLYRLGGKRDTEAGLVHGGY